MRDEGVFACRRLLDSKHPARLTRLFQCARCHNISVIFFWFFVCPVSVYRDLSGFGGQSFSSLVLRKSTPKISFRWNAFCVNVSKDRSSKVKPTPRVNIFPRFPVISVRDFDFGMGANTWRLISTAALLASLQGCYHKQLFLSRQLFAFFIHRRPQAFQDHDCQPQTLRLSGRARGRRSQGPNERPWERCDPEATRGAHGRHLSSSIMITKMIPPGDSRIVFDPRTGGVGVTFNFIWHK